MSWFTRYRRRKHESASLSTLSEVKQFKELMSHQPCTACGQNGLELNHFVRNPTGWEAEISCHNCHFHALINSEGFDFKNVNSKGKARE